MHLLLRQETGYAVQLPGHGQVRVLAFDRHVQPMPRDQAVASANHAVFHILELVPAQLIYVLGVLLHFLVTFQAILSTFIECLAFLVPVGSAAR